MYLVIIQKRSSLLVCRYNALISSEAEFLSEDTWNRDEESSDKQYGHNNESKDPLEGNGFSKELTNAKRCGQNTKFKTDSVVLENDQEEQSIN